MTVFRQEVEKIKREAVISVDGVEAKELWRAKIAADTEAFLARGGVIQVCENGETTYETDSKRFHFRRQDAKA